LSEGYHTAMNVDVAKDLPLRIRTEQIRMAYRQLPVIFVFPTVMGFLSVSMLWTRVSHYSLLLWLVLVTLCFGVVGAALHRLFMRKHSNDTMIDIWGQRFTIFATIAGFSWGLSGYMFFTPSSLATQAMVGAFVYGGAAAQMVLTSVYKPAFYTSIPLLLLPITVRMAMEWDGLHLLMSIISVPYFIMLSRFQKNIHTTLVRTLRLQFENEALVQLLQEKNIQVEKANQAKSRFLAAASHDLRQPLHAQGLLVLELEARTTDPESRTILGYIKRANKGMGELLNALLDISRLDADVVKPQREHFHIMHLLSALEEDFTSLMREKGIRFKVVSCKAVIYSDPLLLKQVLSNLLANALKYTRNGSVMAGCRRRGNNLRIEIRDSGIGIPEHRQKEIFEEFTQLSNPERDREKGLGLGLAIVDRLSRLLKHPIGLVSSPGNGSRFYIDVPVADPANRGRSKWDSSGSSPQKRSRQDG